MPHDIPLILASRSPRRRELLDAMGLDFDVIEPDEDAEDARRTGESPRDFVRRAALQKARNVAAKIPRGRIVACDTVVLRNDEILGKPKDRDDARRMIRLLRGTVHRVLSGLCLLVKEHSEDRGRFALASETTELCMQPISDAQVEAYLDGETWRGKAGAFGYQDRNAWISVVDGSESNIVGLPMERLEAMLSANAPKR